MTHHVATATTALAAARLLDLRYVVGRLEAHRAEMLAALPGDSERLSVEQEARWHGAFTTLTGVLADYLWPCLEEWEAGQAYSRAGAQLLGDEGKKVEP